MKIKLNKLQIKNLPVIMSSIFIIFFTIAGLCNASPIYSDEIQGPQIEPSVEEYELDMNTNFRILCSANEPIRWYYKYSDEIPITTDLESYEIESMGKYGAQITLKNVTANFVRYYYCVAQSATDDELTDEHNINRLENEGKLSKIYIFVRDTKDLLAPHHDVPVIYANEDSFTIIPCRPTAKDVEVVLETSTGEFYDSADSEEFDPKIGFRFYVRGLIDSGIQFCRPKLPSDYNSDEQIEFILNVSEKRESKNDEPFVHAVKIIDKPVHGHVIEGHPFNITCTAVFNPNTKIGFEWELRKDRNPPINLTTNSQTIHNNDTTATNKLTILNSRRIDDSGEYFCIVRDSKKRTKDIAEIKVLGENEFYIDLQDPSKRQINKIEQRIDKKPSRAISINVDYQGYPHPSIEWKKNNLVIEKSDPSFRVTTSDARTQLEILHPELRHSGEYEVIASNGHMNKTLKYSVYLIGSPILFLHEKYNVREGSSVTVECSVDSYPSALVTWIWQPCQNPLNWNDCSNRNPIIFSENNRKEIAEFHLKFDEEVKSVIHKVHRLTFKPNEPGVLNCSAANSYKKDTIGQATRSTDIRVTDIPTEVNIIGYDHKEKVAVGDKFELICAALVYDFSNNLVWYHNDREISTSRSVEIINTKTNYSYRSILKFNDIQHHDSGMYECRALLLGSQSKTKNDFETLVIHDPAPPTLDQDSFEDGSVVEKKIGDSFELNCRADGIPKPTIQWYKDDQLIDPEFDNSTQIDNDNTTLRIQFIKPKQSNGFYKCLVANRLKTIERTSELRIADMPVLTLGWIIFICGIIAVLIVFIVFLCIRVCKDAKIRKQLKEMRMENFESGAVEHINPALTLDEQAELLPYDKRFEFPREKLHLGKQLGAGAFGVVHKATAEGILPDEKETTVAVKMVKKTADNEVVRALGSELKIMVHLGQHLNVVNLLGAVTKNIFKRELMVIVEFCRYGNVQNFLLKNRKRFINQINPDTDLIDPQIVSNDQRLSANDSEYNSSQGLRYVNLEFSNYNSISNKNQNNNNINDNSRSSNDPRPGTRGGRPNSRGYIRQSDLYGYGSQVDSAMTQQTLVHSIHEGDEILSNNSVQPAWRSNYKSDSNDSDDVMEITTSHLVSWGFQVARGMDYLASRKVLHGDLAARNILLCEDNIVKICDFGLARSMYKNDNYKKDKDARLPIKWLALESLGDRVFSTRSDVWSFGIVLWEFFSLSKVPYPGMAADQTLYEKLVDGYRMEKPPYANQELYEIMLECWRTNPDSRPLFDELEIRFSNLLEKEVTSHYIDLNEHYLRINADYQSTGQTDYLALMGSPDELAPAPPRYVNGNSIPEIKIENSNEYLKMSPGSNKNAFSPNRVSSDDNYVHANNFNFNEPQSPTLSNNMDSPMTKNRRKNSAIPEEIPMLARPSLSDSESESISPDLNKKNSTKNFSNFYSSPTQSHKSNDIQTTQLTGDDNYVNVKAKPEVAPRKFHPNSNREAFTNPSYLILDNINEKNKS